MLSKLINALNFNCYIVDPVSKLITDIGKEIKRRLELKTPVKRTLAVPFISVPLETGIITPDTKLKESPKGMYNTSIFLYNYFSYVSFQVLNSYSLMVASFKIEHTVNRIKKLSRSES